jgi:hypothetical protein
LGLILPARGFVPTGDSSAVMAVRERQMEVPECSNDRHPGRHTIGSSQWLSQMMGLPEESSVRQLQVPIIRAIGAFPGVRSAVKFNTIGSHNKYYQYAS